MDKQKFDIAVIGSGPAGYVAAIRAAQYKKTVALIEAKEIGGTCLNRGCIPTKTLIANAEVLKKIKMADSFGIRIPSYAIDYKAMKERKDQVVNKMRTSLEKLIKDNLITLFDGHASFTSPCEIKVMGKEPALIEAEKIIIATGSEPRNMKAFPFDHQLIHDSTSILELTALPKSLVIIGGGVVGCEFASLFAELGVDVTIIELLPQILATEGQEIGDFMHQSLKKKKIAIATSATVESIEKNGQGIIVHIKGEKNIAADMALVAVGRKFNTDQIGLDKAQVLVQENGIIPVNEHLQTNSKHIYAIGDITGQWLLAHFASHQGVVAADNACGKRVEMHNPAVPSVIFTNPEVASVGLTLVKARELGFDAVIGKFPFQALGKSQALLETEGFAQVVVSNKTGQILGAQVIGYGAATLIAEMTLAIQNELTIECIQETIHAHPTISEAWQEAALLATGIPIHYPPKKR